MSNVQPIPCTDYGYMDQLWEDILEFIGNPYGVAGLMANFYAESKCIPYIKQGNTRPPWTPSETYTNKVNSGEIPRSQFISDDIGYSFPQWTISSRKSGYYDFRTVSTSSSIGDYDRALDYVKYELLNGFQDVFTVLINAPSVRIASDYALHHYEMPADQSTAVEDLREGYGLYIYNKYSGSSYHTVTVTVDGNGFAYAQPDYAVVGTPINLYQNAFDQDTFTGWTVMEGGVIIDSNDSFLMPNSHVWIVAHFTGSTPTPPTPTQLDANTIAIISKKWRYFIPNLQ